MKMQLLGHQSSNGRLSRAHETNERDIGDIAVALH
jgi:hypothetical protein